MNTRKLPRIPSLVQNNHISVRDMSTKVIPVERMLAKDSFKEEVENGAFDKHVFEYYDNYFPARPEGYLKMCDILSGQKCYMEICRMLLGFSEERGTVDEVSDCMIGTGKTFSISQVEDLYRRFNQGEKAIGLIDVGGDNLFILDDGRRMELLYVTWKGRSWKVGNNPDFLVNNLRPGTRLFLRN